MSARVQVTDEADGPIVRLDDLRRRKDAGPSSNRKAAAELAAAIVEALPALIQAARVVSESGEWSCQEPIPRIGRSGEVEEWEDCGACLGCRMAAAQEMLAEVEL